MWMKHTTIWTGCAAMVLAVSPHARAQDAPPPKSPPPPAIEPPSATEVQLRREIASLRDRLAQAEQRIRALESERASMVQELARARQTKSEQASAEGTPALDAPTEPMAQVPADPFASPASMLNELRKRYELEFADVPHDTDPAIEAYKQDAKAWCTSGVRDLRARREWLLRVIEITPRPGDRRKVDALVRVIDEGSTLPIGKAFDITLDATHARKIEAGKDRYPYWRATVVLAAAPVFNEARTDPGVFEHPAFIGRYCAFGEEINVRLVQGVREAALKKTKTPPASGR